MIGLFVSYLVKLQVIYYEEHKMLHQPFYVYIVMLKRSVPPKTMKYLIR